jgi:hypothetical protein
MIANESHPPEVAARLTEVERLLATGQLHEALTAAEEMGGSPWADNARAVCLMRLGRATQAAELLRPLVFDRTGFGLRPDADPLFQANYATALLLDGNADGFHGVLSDIRDRTHPAAAKLTAAVHRWKATLSWWERVRLLVGAPTRLPALDVPPGDL